MPGRMWDTSLLKKTLTNNYETDSPMVGAWCAAAVPMMVRQDTAPLLHRVQGSTLLGC